jgi:hypothetical protein
MIRVHELLVAVGYSTKRKRGDDNTLLKHGATADCTMKLLEFMQNDRLLKVWNHQCPYVYKNKRRCEKIMELKESTKYNGDGWELICSTHHDHISIRHDSWFANHKLRLSSLAHIFHLLSCKSSALSVSMVFKEIKLTTRTVYALLRDIQQKMWTTLCENHKPTFDPSDEIEIDEMWIDWKQWEEHVGPAEREEQWRSGNWIIGIINRARTKLWIECIPNRKRQTFQSVIDPLLKQWLFRKCRIHTDAHKSYDYLKSANTHYVINKVQDGFGIIEYTFWGNTIKTNVNKIENNWKHLRTHLRLRHAKLSPQFLHLNIAEYMYNWYKLDWFDLIRFP